MSRKPPLPRLSLPLEPVFVCDGEALEERDDEQRHGAGEVVEEREDVVAGAVRVAHREQKADGADQARDALLLEAVRQDLKKGTI